MRINKNIKLFAGLNILVGLLLFSGIFTFFYNRSSVKAQSTEYCGEDIYAYYDAKLAVDADQYDVYVKLGKRGQSTKVKLQIESDSKCTTIGEVRANGESYKKIGAWDLKTNQEPRFVLASSLFDSLPDANRPEVLLVSKVDPVCIPDKKCDTKINGEKGYIVPTHTSLAINDLVVKKVSNPKNDQITKVDYYASNRYLYTTNEIEDFNMGLVPGGSQTISRIVNYKSGQKVVLENQVYVSFTKDFSNLLYRTFYSNKTWLKVVGVLLLIALITTLILSIFHLYRRRQQWKINHGLLQEEARTIPDDPNTPEQPIPLNQPVQEIESQAKNNIETALRFALPIVGIIAVALFGMIVIDNYFLEIFRVDGISMERTLHTDDRLAVNKTRSTWANINSQKYIPKRGEVIIFTKPANILSDEPNEIEYVVKRVIGLPGERIFVNKGTVTVYNTENPKGFNPDKDQSWAKTYVKGDEDKLDVTLAENEIFVSGDNRPDSLDSRINGPIDIQYIIGHVEARILPFDDRQRL
jgi:signal peptidase I